MLQRLVIAILALALALAPLSVPAQNDSAGARHSAGAGETAEFDSGVELYRNGFLEQSLNRLRGFVIRNPQSPLVPDAYLTLARIFHDQGNCGDARPYLNRIGAGHAPAVIQLLEGSCLVQQGRAEEGIQSLQPLQDEALANGDRALLFERLGQAYGTLGQPLKALLFFRQAVELSPRRDPWLDQVHQLLRQEPNELVLEEAAFMFRGSAIGQDALLQQALRAELRGEREPAAALAGQVLADPTPFPYRDEARALLSRLGGEARAEKEALGVILPFSGRYATFAELVKRGMDLALQLHNQGNGHIRLLYRDSGAEPQFAGDAVATLANVDRVMAVAGPLTGAAAQAAAERAQSSGVPLVALSPREGLPQVGSYIFRNSLTSRQQARALARYAVSDAGMSTFGVLFPESRLGQEMLTLFSEEVTLRGGRVVAMQSYAEGATDFRRQIKLLMGKDPDAPDEAKKPKTPAPGQPAEPESPPEPPPFDALFIPDYANTVGLIAPQLAYYGLEDVAMLGINGWNSPDLIRLAGRFVEGAVFVDGFFPDSPSPVVQEFVALYRDTYNETPTILEAQAFDTAGILLYLLSRPDVSSRSDLREALASLQNYPGVTGNLAVAAAGEIERDLFLIRVESGRLVQVPFASPPSPEPGWRLPSLRP